MDNKKAASVAIFNEKGQVLLCIRACRKHPHPGLLSLPSSYIKEGDVMEEKIVEDVKRKLGIDIELIEVIGTHEGQQAEYHLHMTDFAAKIIGDHQTLKPDGTNYTEAFFVDPRALDTRPHDGRGFCTQVMRERLEKDPDFWKKYV